MIPFRSKRFFIAVIVVVIALALLLPAFVAFRYTAPDQRGQFLSRPWRGWSFVYSALAVPTESELKTSGMALRKADWLFKGTVVDPIEVQLLFVPQDRPYAFTNVIAGRDVTSTVVPSYRFIWQVRGVIDALPVDTPLVVALMDYETGRMLYDIRDDLLPSETVPSKSPVPTASPTEAT